MLFLVLIIILAVVIVVLNFWVLGIIIVISKRKKVKKLKNSFSIFATAKLMRRFGDLPENTKENNELKAIYGEIVDLDKRDSKQIIKRLKQLEENLIFKNIFKIIVFNKNLNQISKDIEEFEKNYLAISFKLFDITSDIEIEKAIIKSLMETFSKLNNSLFNSPEDRIRNNSKLIKKSERIKKTIANIQDKIDINNSHLNKEFIESVKKLDKNINKFSLEIDFMYENIKHLNEDLKIPLSNIVSSYNENKNILIVLDQTIKNYVKQINFLKKQLNENIDNINIKKGNENLNILNEKVSELNLIINSNIDFFKFNSKYHLVVEKLEHYTNKHNPIFISEIKRHKLLDEQKRLLGLDDSLNKFINIVRRYKKTAESTITKETPQQINVLLVDVLNEYKQYTENAFKNIEDISLINNSTNKINDLIAIMNTSLLQTEHNLNYIPGLLNKNYNKRKEVLQNKVSHLREQFKNNVKKIPTEHFDYANKLRREIEQLTQETKGSAFEIFFLKETIIFLNKYNGTNNQFDKLLQSIKNSYKNEDYGSSLRKAKETIEIYGIKQ